MEMEQTAESYVAEAEQFLMGVQEYDVDFERLRTFCNCYPAEMPLSEERKQLSQAVEDFDYEAITQILEQIIAKLKKD